MDHDVATAAWSGLTGDIITHFLFFSVSSLDHLLFIMFEHVIVFFGGCNLLLTAKVKANMNESNRNIQ